MELMTIIVAEILVFLILGFAFWGFVRHRLAYRAGDKIKMYDVSFVFLLVFDLAFSLGLYSGVGDENPMMLIESFKELGGPVFLAAIVLGFIQYFFVKFLLKIKKYKKQ